MAKNHSNISNDVISHYIENSICEVNAMKMGATIAIVKHFVRLPFGAMTRLAVGKFPSNEMVRFIFYQK